MNNEFIDVYLVTVKDEVPVEAFTLQEEEVAAVRQVSTAHVFKIGRACCVTQRRLPGVSCKPIRHVASSQNHHCNRAQL